MVVLVFLVLAAAGVCARVQAPAAPPEPPDPARVEAAGLHNVFRLTEKLYSGSSPDGEEGFRSLQKLGIKTVLTVDGMRPDVERAHKYGMRYVHLPIGYDGMTRAQAVRIVKAVRDLLGPVYLHCHHGQHRGPAAAAVAHLCLDERCTVEMVIAEMRRAGTDPHYTGLYAAPRQIGRLTAAELDRVPADFPEVAPIPALTEAMDAIDGRLDNLKLVKAAGWRTPADYPDLDPPHEALQLREQFREVARMPEVRDRPGEFRRLLAGAEESARRLEEVLRGGKDRATADRALKGVNTACASCHTRYRDVPQQASAGKSR
jgi:protein tyrosine phosphatase (PTP) superfamily phosphohydrolase (DUF442 family)